MRWFSAHRETSEISAGRAPRPGRTFRAALFALSCLAGIGFASGERSAARADDGGMMSFLLSGNGGGRARVAAPAYRAEAPVARQRAAFVRKVATSRARVQARNARLAAAHKDARRHQVAAAQAAGAALIQKASLELTQQQPEPKVTAQSLALKAAAAAARPEDAHMRDKTLRRGDIVATASGLRVFLGSAHFPYRAHDFVPVTSTRHVAQRSDLVALDRALRGIRVAAATIQKRVAKKAERIKAPEQRRVAEAKRAPELQTVALAYAPRPEVQKLQAAASAGENPAGRAIERVVRHIELTPATRAGLPPGMTQARGEARKTE